MRITFFGGATIVLSLRGMPTNAARRLTLIARH
jgi:hypothetical protein